MVDENKKLSTSDEVKHKQQRNLMIFALIAILGLSGIYWLFDSDSPSTKEELKDDSVKFNKTTDQVDAQAVWIERAQNMIKEEQAKTADLERKVEEMQKKMNESRTMNESNPKYEAVQQQVEVLKKAVEEREVKNTFESVETKNTLQAKAFSTTPGADMGQNEMNASPANQIDNNVLNLKPKKEDALPKRNPDSYVPAGTFAEAIVLGAADASAGVTSSSKPIPMIFRIIADGTVPNQRKSHLKGCVVIGSVIGDISSERGEINLNRISCTFPNGEIVEQQIDGNVFGMDGKNGIRGNPVWREGALLGRAAVAGSLSGFANGISQSYTTSSISPLGSTQTVDNGAIFKYGMANGASNAMEKLAEYNIKRAEQYHPVIQLSAGQSVDVVFIRGFYLDGKEHADSEQENNAPPTQFPKAESTYRATSNLTLSEQQLEKIKQHENSFSFARQTNSGGTL